MSSISMGPNPKIFLTGKLNFIKTMAVYMVGEGRRHYIFIHQCFQVPPLYPLEELYTWLLGRSLRSERERLKVNRTTISHICTQLNH